MIVLEPGIEQDLVPGERVLGHYQAQIARLTGTGWAASLPPLYATVTNARLILKPQTRRVYDPASIPARQIRRVQSLVLGRRNAVTIGLRDGLHINLFIPGRQSEMFVADMQRMLFPSPRARFTAHVPVYDIHRLIDAIAQR